MTLAAEYAIQFHRYTQTDMGRKAVTYDHENQEVYGLFVKFAVQARNAGYRQFSANAIFERIRWELAIEKKDDGFKMNNNYRAYYARRLMAENPEKFGGFFQIREAQT